eukprot:CAMPEP_0173407858 /NCGR_PEP_ID=MMETSP1356-20130122/68224_1 /TAXON_ID=77927 ORGANISM="Hemiselmis virescens, Strain PCC157" /NCGR_SAMPLE_ID=MMETSP1356 /ASSEMBLY_ACC=CAM_ASM_000847 /LENGTH=470 /DNA_ID=CAMNT_0014369085 /DNA_START=69 /DNA_END=1478 /DNA_ORIENTATION=+
MEWVEGLAILSAVFVVVTVTAVNDYQKEQQFRALNKAKDDVEVHVVRDGRRTHVSIHDLVVGDVVHLSAGDLVPADGAVFTKSDLAISEKMLTGETVLKHKGAFQFTGANNADEPVAVSPAVFAGTQVEEGEGLMVVLAVGTSTYQGMMVEKMNEDDDDKSVLQTKLDDMTALITRAGAIAGALTVLVLLVRFAMAFWDKSCCKESWDNKIHHLEWLRFFVTGVTIFVVAVPEGLPLAVTIALAFSVKKMMTDQNLVRHLSACETMGSATTICSDKTGTLTTGRMKVVRLWCGGQLYDELRTFAEVPEMYRSTLAHSVVINSSFKSNIEVSSSGTVTRSDGNDTECALLLFADTLLAGTSSHGAVREAFPIDGAGRCSIPFSSERKMMSTLVPWSGPSADARGRPRGDRQVHRLFTKGAAEVVLARCDSLLNPDGSVSPLPPDKRSRLEAELTQFTIEGLRTLTLAFRDF